MKEVQRYSQFIRCDDGLHGISPCSINRLQNVELCIDVSSEVLKQISTIIWNQSSGNVTALQVGWTRVLLNCRRPTNCHKSLSSQAGFSPHPSPNMNYVGAFDCYTLNQTRAIDICIKWPRPTERPIGGATERILSWRLPKSLQTACRHCLQANTNSTPDSSEWCIIVSRLQYM